MSNKATLVDYIWGGFPIDSRLFEMIKHINHLKGKRQLGLVYRNPFFLGGSHTRYEHSIGTLYVATRLINACRKFSQYIEISEQQEIAFLLSALFHDIGHGPCSHAFERLINYTHEEETIRKVKLLNDEINSTFGEGTCEMVVTILENSYTIKKENKPIKMERDGSKLDLIFILSDLLSGTIDIDRIDYLYRDIHRVHGKKRDFTKIFDYMDLALVNDKPRIVFDVACIPSLEDYLLTRFRNYNQIYFHPWTNTLDKYFEWFIKDTFLNSEINSDLEECVIDEYIKNGPYKTKKAKICADVLEGRNLESVLSRSFENKSDMNVFISKLSSIVEPTDYFYGKITRKVVIYDRNKNSVLIKVGDRVVDLCDASKIIKDKIFQETLSVFVDIRLLRVSLEEQNMSESKIADVIKRIQKLFTASMYEIEKKFMLIPGDVDKIKRILNQTSVSKSVLNEDNYYTYDGMSNNISIRVRTGEEYPYTIKIPASDSTSLTKRQEHIFDENISLSDFLMQANKILAENGYESKEEIKYCLSISTQREKFDIYINGSKLEVAIDSSTYRDSNNREEFEQMLEIELKNGLDGGNTIDLWYFVEQLLKQCEMTPCVDSKYDRAMTKLNLNNK